MTQNFHKYMFWWLLLFEYIIYVTWKRCLFHPFYNQPLPSLSPFVLVLDADVINILCTSNVNIVNQKKRTWIFSIGNILFKIGQIKKTTRSCECARNRAKAFYVSFSGRLLEVRKNNDCFTTKFETLTIKGKGMWPM